MSPGLLAVSAAILWTGKRRSYGVSHAVPCKRSRAAAQHVCMQRGVNLQIVTDIAIPARLDAVPGVAVAIEKFMRETGFPDPAILDIQLALEEAITNTIRHGYRGDPGTITLHGRVSEGLLVVEITDNAPQFNPLTMPDPDVTSSLDERRVGGLGIYLIRQVTDRVAYRFEQGKNILTISKRKESFGDSQSKTLF